MKILIISTFFPPQNSIASLRPYSWAKYWSRDGHDVTVLTTPKREDASSYSMPIDGFSVCEVPIPGLGILRKLFGSTPLRVESEVATIKSDKKNSLRSAIKKQLIHIASTKGIFYGCRFPDLTDLWVSRAYKKVAAERWDLVVSTALPYTVHKVAAKLRSKGIAKHWIADWRDLWVDNHIFLGLRMFHPLERYWERSWMTCADHITTVSKPLADVLASKYGNKVSVVLNGFDPEDLGDIPSDSLFSDHGVLRILYSGTIYRGKQDPEPLFQAIKNLKTREGLSGDQLQVMFCGNNADVRKSAERLGISEFVQYLGFLPRPEVLHLQQSVDLLLFLEYEAPGVEGILTGKIFEYLFAKPYILGVGVSENSSVGQLLHETERGVALGKDVAAIEAHLFKWLKEGVPERRLQNEERFLRSTQARKMLLLLGA